MYTALAIFAAVLGLAVTGAAGYTAWYVFELRRGGKGQPGASLAVAGLYRWTVFDYALVILVIAGLLFLLADLIGVLKDRDLYPYYHYGYLLSGFIFTSLGLLFMLGRIFLLLRLADQRFAPPDHCHEPHQTDHAD